MKTKKNSKVAFDPYTHLAEIILIALVFVAAFFTLWFLYSVSIMEAGDAVIVGPFGSLVQFFRLYFPYRFVADTWEQQVHMWNALYKGAQALLGR